LGSSPSLIIEAKGKNIKITKKGKAQRRSGNPLDIIEKFMRQYKAVAVDGLPRFYGGLVGYMGYDIIRFIESIPDSCKDDLGVSDIKLILADTILIFDRLKHTIKIVSNTHIKNSSRRATERAYEQAIKDIHNISKKLSRPLSKSMPQIEGVSAPISLKSNIKKSAFKKSVIKAKKYIKEGDIIQAVLSQRFQSGFNGDPLTIYRALRSINPSPYMFYLSFGSTKLIGSSPEIMVRSEDGIAEIRPIAGTRPRGKNKKEDEALEKDLLRDPKECAEHLMLVDLGRNDLGRVCKKGSVRLSEFMVIERYSHVMHIVSDCVGKLSSKSSIYELLKSSFPAGTVAGAPKIRAMEIIDELEKTKRGPYAGCVGYFSFSGNLDTCITIRTILVKGKRAYVQAGAGIVADSNPEKEYQETVNKAKGMLKAVAIAKAVK
ncbi:MAG: anthranilate synthase component I, partial [Candidatus Omnitrophica bacterium]|nr:anthranilate synthase component I [Candidatus Omnitrophota bacterium]